MVFPSIQGSQEWICKATLRITLEVISPLKIVEGNELPLSEMMIAHLPASSEELKEKNIRIISMQNEGLRTEEWTVLQ